MQYWFSGYGGQNGGTPLPSLMLYDPDVFPQTRSTDLTPGLSWLAETDDGRLIACKEDDNSGAVMLFKAEGDTLSLQDSRLIDGAAFCHLSWWEKHRVVAGACYGSGDIFTLQVTENGFGEMRSYIHQDAPDNGLTRAHCIIADADETVAYVSNIALDRLYLYDIAADGSLQNERFVQLTTGDGIRHLLLREDQQRLYATTEYQNVVYSFDTSGDMPKLLGKIPSLTADYVMKSYHAGLVMNKAGTRLYVANRGANTITVFATGADTPTGLTRLTEAPVCGDWPRDIALTPDDSHIISCNQRSNSITFLPIGQDGIPGIPDRVIPFIAPSFAGFRKNTY